MTGIGGHIGVPMTVRSKEASWTFIEKGKPTLVLIDPVPALSTPVSDIQFVRDVMFANGGKVVVPPGSAELLPARPESAAPAGPDLARKCWSYRPEWEAGKQKKTCSFCWVVEVVNGDILISLNSANGGLVGKPTGFVDVDFEQAKAFVEGLGYGIIPTF